MSVTVSQRPQKTINSLVVPPQVSKWSAVWHPIVFRFQRADYEIVSVYNGTGGLALAIGQDITDEVEAGDNIYVYAPEVGITGTYEVLSVYTSGSPASTIIEIDAPAITGAAAESYKFINLDRLAYFLEIRILEYTTGSPVETTTDYPRFRPDATGLIKADLQAWLQPLLRARDDHDYLTTVIRDSNLGQPFNIQYREYWQDAGYSDWSDLTENNLHYIANAVKQAGDTWGQNIGEFVMFPPDTQSPPAQGSQGKFLTKFLVPVYFEGYPFSLGYVYSDEFDADGRALTKVENALDINNGLLSTTQDVLTDYSGFINRVLLRGGYPANARAVRVGLRVDGNDAYVEAGYVEIDYVDQGAYTAISETIYIRLNDGCVNNPIYLAWLNPTGAFDYWLFSKAQDHLDKIDNEQVFEGYTEDLADMQARESTLSKDSQEEIIIGADQLTHGQAEGLRHMLASPLVLRFMGYDEDTLLPKWQRVGVKTGSFTIYKTDEQKASLVCTILPPQKYIQQQ